MDLPLAVLLSDALVGGEPRQGGVQRGEAVAGGQADVEQLTGLLRHRGDGYEGWGTEAFMSWAVVDRS